MGASIVQREQQLENMTHRESELTAASLLIERDLQIQILKDVSLRAELEALRLESVLKKQETKGVYIPQMQAFYGVLYKPDHQSEFVFIYIAILILSSSSTPTISPS